MQPTTYDAPPIEITPEEFDRVAGQGYPTAERDGKRIVTVPDAVYENRAQRRASAKRARRKKPSS